MIASAVSMHGYRKRTLDKSGAAAALVVGSESRTLIHCEPLTARSRHLLLQHLVWPGSHCILLHVLHHHQGRPAPQGAPRGGLQAWCAFASQRSFCLSQRSAPRCRGQPQLGAGAFELGSGHCGCRGILPALRPCAQVPPALHAARSEPPCRPLLVRGSAVGWFGWQRSNDVGPLQRCSPVAALSSRTRAAGGH
jgi:hypothetical protein